MQNKDKGDEIEDSPLDMLLVILLEGACKEVVVVVTPSSRHLLNRHLPGLHMSLISAWTREGLPVEGTPKLKSAKSLRKSNLVIREVMNAYL